MGCTVVGPTVQPEGSGKGIGKLNSKGPGA